MRNLKMESYDVVIVGAGIAGTGLAYNLKQICPEKSVLVIDRKEVGSNAGYGYRITFGEMIERYNLPYHHVYNGIKMGLFWEEPLILNDSFYLVNYKKICRHL